MLVPLLQHLSFTRWKISSLLHISEIFLSQYTTFSLIQLISTSPRSVSIEIPSSSLLSPNEYLYFLDPSLSMISKLSSIKVSEIHLLVSSTKSLCFLDPPPRWFRQSWQLKVSESHVSLFEEISVFFWIRVRQWSRQSRRLQWVKFICLSSTEFDFSRSIVEMIRKVPSMESEWNSLLSPGIPSLPFPDLRSRMARTIPSIESN